MVNIKPILIMQLCAQQSQLPVGLLQHFYFDWVAEAWYWCRKQVCCQKLALGCRIQIPMNQSFIFLTFLLLPPYFLDQASVSFTSCTITGQRGAVNLVALQTPFFLSLHYLCYSPHPQSSILVLTLFPCLVCSNSIQLISNNLFQCT